MTDNTLGAYSLLLYGGPQLSGQNKKSQHYKLYSQQDNATPLMHGKTKLTLRRTLLIHGKTKSTHGKTKFTHGKTKKTSWSAVVIQMVCRVTVTH